MALTASTYDTALIMQCASRNDQQDLYPTKAPVFLRDEECHAKVVLLHCVYPGVVVIQSAGDGQELIVGANGGCYFESPLLGITEEFSVEVVANGSTVLISCRSGNVLGCDGDGLPRCVDTIRQGWFLLQHDRTITTENAVVEAAPVKSFCCDHYKNHETHERRENIMKLVTLGKSLDEIDAILLRMYPAEKITLAASTKSEEPLKPKLPCRWMKME